MAYKDPERQKAYARDWLKRNPEKAREAVRRWRARNPELLRERRRKYRRAARARDGAKLNAQRAAYLARGGTNFIENILPACRGCNGRKHTMTEEEFRALRAAERDADKAVDRRMSGVEPSAG